MSVQTVPLGSLTKIRTGKLDANASSPDGKYPFFTCSRTPLSINSYSYDCECVLVAGNGDLNVKYYNGKFDAYQRTYIIESQDKTLLDTRYLYHFLDRYLVHLRGQSIGGVIKYIKLGNLTDANLPLPPLPEQKRIAAILDQADALREKRRAAIAKLDELLQSVFLDMFGDPVTNPKGWDVSTLSNLLLSIDSGWSPKCEDRPANINEWGILKLGSVTWCNFNPSENKALPNGARPRPELEVRPGDILFSRKNTYELVAASAYVWETRPNLMLPDLVFRLILKNENAVIPIFLWQQLVNGHMRKGIQSLAGGAAGSMPNISKAKLKAVQVITPPIELQQRYVNVIQSYRRQNLRMQESLYKLDSLFSSLQQRAFRGDL